MARGDESGIEPLACEFVRANTGSAEPSLVDELMRLAREIVAAFNQVNPGCLDAVLRARERDLFEGIAGELDNDGGDD